MPKTCLPVCARVCPHVELRVCKVFYHHEMEEGAALVILHSLVSFIVYVKGEVEATTVYLKMQ